MTGIIYKITNTINNKSYIGKTYDKMEERLKQHIKESKRVRGQNRPLYRAFNKYGVDNFSIECLGEYDESELETKEQEYIDLYDTYSFGYNATKGGDGKRYLSHTDDEIISMYEKIQNVRATARLIGCDVKTIRKILDNYSVARYNPSTRPIKTSGSDIAFNSITECAEWLISNKICKSKNHQNVRKQLTIPLQTGKQYCGLTFEYI